jgi:asparagine synthase (glutamine-hydrolysing)
MCGICGLLYPEFPSNSLSSNIYRMTEELRHRGPDDEGIYIEDGIALGHRRLSIIDLDHGKQPMIDERGFVIVYNGELYNFKSLGKELETKGEVFKTRSDTEVVLRSYITWGKDCLDKFNGMYAFCIYNKTDRSLFLARDRLGIKPLFYSIHKEGFAFSSELRSLISSSFVRREVDLSHIPHYISHLYLPGESTPYKAIRKLLPGHWLFHKDRQTKIHCYWDIEERAALNERVEINSETEEQLKSLIHNAISMHTVSDVPIGTFLSGGLDSGIVTASLTGSGNGYVKTFSVGFTDDPEYDETPLAREMAKQYHTDHHDVRLSPNDLLENWEHVMQHFGQPFGDSSALPVFLISRFAGNSVKVILSGDGGDEQFGGYGNYRRYLQYKLSLKMLGENKSTAWLPSVTRLLGGFAGLFSTDMQRKIATYQDLLLEKPQFVYRNLSAYLQPEEVRDLLGNDLQKYVNSEDYRRITSINPAYHLDKIMIYDIKNYMVDDVLHKVDMMSMAVGLEVRVPLLDYRIVEMSAGIPWRYKVSFNETKKILRRLYSTALPESIIRAPKKGFSVPLDRWFRGPLRDVARDTLLGTSCCQRGILNTTSVEKILNDHVSGKASNGDIIWTLLSLEKWFQQQKNICNRT